MGARFMGWGIALARRIVTNDELSQTLATSDEWIRERTGIRERRIGGTVAQPRRHRGPRAPSKTPASTRRTSTF